jgi:hypothetical protein
MTYKEVKRAQRRILIKALDDLYMQCEDDDLSTLTLELNYNPYNMGHKITTTHHTIGYAERYPNSDNGEPNS